MSPEFPDLLNNRKGYQEMTQDPIEDMAFCEIFIACDAENCQNIFEPTLNEGVRRDMDSWSKEMARRARFAGWISISDKVFCPIHAKMFGEL